MLDFQGGSNYADMLLLTETEARVGIIDRLSHFIANC